MTDRQTDYVMVPRDPEEWTVDQYNAFWKAYNEHPEGEGKFNSWMAGIAAMIAAAPQPPLPSVEDVALIIREECWTTIYEEIGGSYDAAKAILSLFTAGREALDGDRKTE